MAISKMFFRGTRSPREALLPTFGPLERRTLDEVWRLKEANVREVMAALGGPIAYTTVMTTLDRLYKKGFLDRRKENRAFIYFAQMSREEMHLGAAEAMIGGLMDVAAGKTRPLLACIVDAVSSKDKELLDDLERLVKEKKAALKNK